MGKFCAVLKERPLHLCWLRNLEERFAAAREMASMEPPPGVFVVDAMGDGASVQYAAYPG